MQATGRTCNTHDCMAPDLTVTALCEYGPARYTPCMVDGLPSVALVGAGKLGSAMLHAWLSSRSIHVPGSVVFDPAPSSDTVRLCSRHHLDIRNRPGDAAVDVMICAIKPADAVKTLPPFAPVAQQAAVLSVMAGVRLDFLSSILGENAAIARAMPNLPALAGAGITGVFAGKNLSPSAANTMDRLLNAFGETVWLEKEMQIDLVTAVSGSGPAYYFLLTEALEQAARTIGLAPDTAAKLARATCTGSGAMLKADGRSPELLRRAVTSPGGTTEAALDILDGNTHRLAGLVEDAVRMALKRAEELSG